MSNEKKKILLKDIEQMEVMQIKDKNYKIKRKRYILKGISSLFSAIFNTSGYYSIWTLGSSIVYFISFRRQENPYINYQYGYFLIPIIDFSIGISLPLGGFIEDIIGGKRTIFLSYLIICVNLLFFLFSYNIHFDYILMCIIGFGISIGINITRKNVCSYFMNIKDLIDGLHFLISGFLSAGMTIFFEKQILNEPSERPLENVFYYSRTLSQNYQKLIVFLIYFLMVNCFISLLLYFPNDPDDTIKFGFGEKIQNKNDNNKIIINISEQLQSKKDKNKISTFKLFLIIFFFFPTINLINITWIQIGIYYRINTYYLQMIRGLYSIIGGFSSVIFYFFAEKINFKVLLVLFAFSLSVISFIFPITFNYHFIFVIEILIISFILTGYKIIIESYITKIYDIGNYIKIGIIRSCAGLSEILSSGLAFYLQNIFSGNINYVFKLMYIISGCSNLISLVIGLYEIDDKSRYNL